MTRACGRASRAGHTLHRPCKDLSPSQARHKPVTVGCSGARAVGDKGMRSRFASLAPSALEAHHSWLLLQVSTSKSTSSLWRSHSPVREPRCPRSGTVPFSLHYFLAVRSRMPLSHESTASDCVRAVATAPRPSIARSARELSSRHTLLALSLAAVQLGARTSTSA